MGLAGLLFAAPPVHAHSVSGRQSEAPALAVECLYSDGKPMRYAEVLVYGPTDEDVEYQNGRTDRRGRFAFVPDREGVWEVRVQDGMGHALNLELDGTEGSPEGTKPASLPDRPVRAVAGVSIIANLALATGLLRRRK